jgi:hypothetical protein
LFSNLNIETQREVAKEVSSGPASGSPSDADAVKPEVVSFIVKANFGASKVQTTAAAAPANQVAMKK